MKHLGLYERDNAQRADNLRPQLIHLGAAGDALCAPHPAGGRGCHTAYNAIVGPAGGRIRHVRRDSSSGCWFDLPTCQCRVPARLSAAERQRAYRERQGEQRKLVVRCTPDLDRLRFGLSEKSGPRAGLF